MEDWKKEMNDTIDRTSKILQESGKDLLSTLEKERKKVEIRAQIGHHERAAGKAYSRLGEAYFNHVENGASMDSMQDVIDLVRSNKKVVELLESQLKDLEKPKE